MIQDGPCSAAEVNSGSQGIKGPWELGLCSLSPRALEMLQKDGDLCWQSVVSWRWQWHRVMGGCSAGCSLLLLSLVQVGLIQVSADFVLQAALPSYSFNNISPKLWSKMFWVGAMRFLPAGSKRDCMPWAWDRGGRQFGCCFLLSLELAEFG